VARPKKDGLEYFPLDTKFDDEVLMIDAMFGCEGTGILVKMWQIIYANNYYINWGEREVLVYKSRLNADINIINDVINECLKWGVFNENLYKKYQILTSGGIQKRFIEATQRRKEIEFVKEYLLLKDIKKMYPRKNKKGELVVNVVINRINAVNNRVNDVKSTQREIEIEREIEREIEIESNILSSETVKEIVDYLNAKAKTKYRHTSNATKELIRIRWSEGNSVDDFKTVIDKKCAEWIGTEFEKFLRPSTLFSTKFEGYLNQNIIKSKSKSAKDNFEQREYPDEVLESLYFNSDKEDDDG
jgi:uncharacterized phage protein (TIGR02220 family)